MAKAKTAVQKWEDQRQTAPDRWDRIGAQTEGPALNWDEAPPALLASVVSAVVDGGDAILFGRTSDGGALLLQVLNGGGKHKLYPTSAEEVEAALRSVLDIATNA
jgi:hypothetical protein